MVNNKKNKKVKPVEKKSTKKSNKKTENSNKNHIKDNSNSNTKNHKPNLKNDSKKEDEKTKTIKKSSKSTDWKSISIVLGVIALILILIIMVFSITKSNNMNSNKINNMNSNNNQGNIKTSNLPEISLLVIRDKTCKNCNEDKFISQIKTNLIPNLKVQKISVESPEAKDILKKLNIKQVPVYLFSKSIDLIPIWNSKLKQVFIPVNINSGMYMLNPQIIPLKISTENIKTLPNSIIIGNKSAPITIYEFSDLQCPYCAIAEGNAKLLKQFTIKDPNYKPAIPNLETQYIKNGKVKLIYYNVPSEKNHQNVTFMHNALLCANEQGKAREYEKKVYLNRSDWIGNDLNLKAKLYAKELNLNQNQFNSCLDSKKYYSQIKDEIKYAKSLGIEETPVFFIGKTYLAGAQDFREFKLIIDSKLAELK